MKAYNICTLDISNGLDNEALASSNNFIQLIEAPPNAKVTLRLNDNTADEILLREGFSIEAQDINRIYCSCNAVNGGKIKIALSKSSDSFKINPIPSLEFSDEVLNALRFAPSNIFQTTIAANSNYEFTDNVNSIRFHATDEIGVELENSSIKYPMFEDIINTSNLTSSIKFHNDNTENVVLTIWSM